MSAKQTPGWVSQTDISRQSLSLEGKKVRCFHRDSDLKEEISNLEFRHFGASGCSLKVSVLLQELQRLQETQLIWVFYDEKALGPQEDTSR